MNAIEIRNLIKSFGGKLAVNGLDMTVPAGAIYGFIGENGSGKSTTEKMICGLLHPTGGGIRLFGKDGNDPEARSKIGVLIEMPGCFPNISVWGNMQLQAANLGIKNADTEIARVLKLVHMEGAASNRFRNCSLGMRQRVGIAMALMGNPKLLILDEPINGLDADGMRIMREVLQEMTQNGCTVLISSHILGELEKIATHYGIIRNGRMLREMTAAELEADCPSFAWVNTAKKDMAQAFLLQRFQRVKEDEERGTLRIYDAAGAEEVASYLYANHAPFSEIGTDKIGLEEYYMDLMGGERK